MPRPVDVKSWNVNFGSILNKALIFYRISRAEFAEAIDVSESAVRQWTSGRSFPRKDTMDSIQTILPEKINGKSVFIAPDKMNREIAECLGVDTESILSARDDRGQYVVAALQYCYNRGKGAFDRKRLAEATGKTQIVVFDFDGTLTERHNAGSTWEAIWIALGYDVSVCRELHGKYTDGEISHAEWCRITEERFREKGLNVDTISLVASGMKLLNGCEETFKTLKEHNIRLCIVSGSIDRIIRAVVKELVVYIDEIKANEFQFTPDGALKAIIGTPYDFEGKAAYIIGLADKYHISPKDILFVGNSNNDKYVSSMSGARTLCINPRYTDPSDRNIWDKYLDNCNNLKDILPIVDPSLT